VGNDQNPRNKVKQCAWCEYAPALPNGKLCFHCENDRPLDTLLAAKLK